jgi:hypothetical protein
MRELTKEQEELLALVATVKWREEAARNAAANEEAMAAARAESDRLWAIRRAEAEAEEQRQRKVLIPLKEALKAAGIQLAFNGYYDGCWMKFKVGNGPVVELEDGLDTFEDD